MNIVEAVGHSGMTQMILPENSLVLKTHPMVAHLRWEGQQQRKRDWTAGEVAFVPGGSEMISRMNDPYHGLVVCLNQNLVQMIGVDFDVSLSAKDFAAISTREMAALTSSLVELSRYGVLDRHPTVAESLASALVVETSKTLSPKVAKRLAGLKGGLSIERRRRIVEFVDANLHRQLTIAEMAAVASLSPYHFSRSFKHSTGMTPAEFLLRRRIERAKQRLREMLPIAQVAADCGFASQSHLATSFKALVGLTPKQYRDQLS